MLNLKAEFKSVAGIDWKPGVAVPEATCAKSSSNNEAFILAKIAEQGDKVREIKAGKAPKDQVDAAVKVLLDLKAEYKKVSGKDWKPGAQPATVPQSASPATSGTSDLSGQIAEQGDKVRKLKAEKASKKDIDTEVKILLDLKAKYKAASGEDWKPGQTPAAASSVVSAPSVSASPSSPCSASLAPGSPASPSSSEVDKRNDLLVKIAQQGDKVRSLKASKADKSTVDVEIKALLALKSDFKSSTGEEWKPDLKPIAQSPTSKVPANDSLELNARIVEQGDKVRKLKADKASKGVIDTEVKALLSLKATYQTLTGSEWKPGVVPATNIVTVTPSPQTTMGDNKVEALVAATNEQAEKVRQMKSSGASKVISELFSFFISNPFLVSQ